MSEWIENTEGRLTVSKQVVVEVELFNGEKITSAAGSFMWGLTGNEGNIKAYRIVAPKPPHDPVNKPSHYMLFPEQGIEFIDVRDVLIERLKDFGPKQIDYWSRAFEYLARAGGKNGVEDIKKAKWYLDRLVKTLEE